MSAYIYAVGSVILVSLVSLVGLFTLSFKEAKLKKYLFVLVSLAVGALLGDAFIHLIPQTFLDIQNPQTISLLIIGGIFIFFILEKFLHWHHHDGLEDRHPHPLGPLILISDGLHNLIDGLLIGASFLISREIGFATTIAVILHEIPQEVGDFGVLLQAGYSRHRALWLNFLSGLFAVVGVCGAFLLGRFAASFALFLLPLAAGGFIYIALSDLIPELQKTKSLKYSLLQLFSILIGLASMLLLLLAE